MTTALILSAQLLWLAVAPAERAGAAAPVEGVPQMSFDSDASPSNGKALGACVSEQFQAWNQTHPPGTGANLGVLVGECRKILNLPPSPVAPQTVQPPAGAPPPVPCLDEEQISNSRPPSDLYRAITTCVQQRRYQEAVALFALAGMNSRFDIERLTEPTTADAAESLVIEMFDALPDEQREGFNVALAALSTDQRVLADICRNITRVGYPTYAPGLSFHERLLAFGARVQPKVVKEDFNAANTWLSLQQTYLKCPMAAPIVARRNSGPVARELKDFSDSYYVSALAFSADSSRLAVNFMVQGHEVHVWDWRHPEHSPAKLDYQAGTGDGYALAYSPDGKLLAVRHNRDLNRNVVRIWDTGTGAIVHDIAELTTEAYAQALAFSPDGKILVRTMWAREGESVSFFRTDTWERQQGVSLGPFEAGPVAFSPDGRWLAVAGTPSAPLTGRMLESARTQIHLIDAATRRVVRTIDNAFPDANMIKTLCWSPDGQHIAAGVGVGGSQAGPDAVKVFEVASGNQVAGIHADSATVTGLGFTPDGRYLIAGSVDNKVMILDGQSFAILQKISGDARSLGISRDSRYLAIGKVSNISIWELN